MKLLIFILLLFCFYTDACTLTMGYRLSERLPLIKSAPNNNGLYKDLFTLAANKINCKLAIIREPKKRLLKKLQVGKLDFYPGFTFTEERSKYAAFIENGLENEVATISDISQPLITNINSMKSKVLLVAQGGPDYGGRSAGARLREVENLTISQAINYILKGKADFYIYPKASIEYHLKHYPNSQIKRHKCCSIAQPMYLGFSLYSKYYIAKDSQKIGMNQLPASHSKAFQFQQAIKELKTDGTISQLYNKYYQ